MLVFIDDSGDPGFKLDKGSTKFFVISVIIFDDELEAEKTAIAIKELRRFLKFPDDMEFKFNKSSKIVREKFLRTINPFCFKIRSLIIDKGLIRSDELKRNKNSFYSYAIKTALKHSNNSILNAKIKIDGNGDRTFRKNFLSYLRRQLNSKEKRIIKNCKLVSSRGNVLIQMADMIAGSARRSCDKSKTDARIYKNIIKRHIDDEWSFK
ncbi:MAG: DUF3800 domain-containing protein [Candidatus Kuenenbacteria bacterium]